MIVRDERPREVVDLSRAIRLREVNECNGDLTPICPRAAALPLSSPRGKNREKKTSGVSALVHATPGVTASRFAGRSANRTTPITRNTITSVKFRGTL